MAFEQVFTLTPKNSFSFTGIGQYALMSCNGIFFAYDVGGRQAFNQQIASDEHYYTAHLAGDAAEDYSSWLNRLKVPYVQLYYNLNKFQPHKEVALTFRFDASLESRILMCTNAGVLGEEILHPGDNQFLIQIESTDIFELFFIHAKLDGSLYGGDWYFKGIDGYIA